MSFLSIAADVVSAPWNALNGGQLTQMQKDAYAAEEKSQIQSVADNAASYYGSDSAVAHITQEVADKNEAQAATDVDTIARMNQAKGTCDAFDVTCWLNKLNTLKNYAIGFFIAGVLVYAAILFGPAVAAALSNRRR